MTTPDRLRVAIVEDNPRFRSTLERFVSELPQFSVAESYGRADRAIADLERAIAAGEPLPWDLALMDLELPRLNGIEATRRIKAIAPAVSVVVLTVFEDPATILEAISAGADGYLVKRATAPELRSQLAAIVRDGAPLTPGVARTLLTFVRETTGPPAGRPAEPAPSRLDLTEREQDVLRCIVRGRSYQQAADELGIAFETVRTHVRHLYRKLQVHTVAEAVSLAIRKKLI